MKVDPRFSNMLIESKPFSSKIGLNVFEFGEETN
jgi:hypothetical protein